MKNSIRIFLFSFICISCGTDDQSTPIPNSPRIAAFHILDFQGTARLKYNFDDTGNLIKLQDVANGFIYNYEYDTNNKLVSLSKTDINGVSIDPTMVITYSLDGRINALGERTFIYNPDLYNYIPVEGYDLNSDFENYFIEDSSYASYMPNDNEQQLSFKAFYANTMGKVQYSCRTLVVTVLTEPMTGNQNTTEICYQDNIWDYNEDYLLNEGLTGDSRNYEYNSQSNPLYSQNNNLADICVFYSDQSSEFDVFPRLFLSKTNMIKESFNSAEINEYTYELNADGLPVSVNRQFYFLGEAEPIQIYGNYYYQGDTIPE